MRKWGVVRWSLLTCLLAAPLSLTTLRLIHPLNDVAVQLVGLAPLAMPMYALVLLAVSVPTVRHRGRTIYLVPAATALVGLVLHAVWFAPQVTGQVREPDQGAPTFTLMASNLLKGQADAAALLRAATEEDVDVLVTEEITPQALDAMQEQGLSTLYPYTAGLPERGVIGTMIFSRTPLSQVERLTTGFGSWRVQVGDELTLIAVHTTAPTKPEGWRNDFNKLIATVRAQPPDIILGDFNATADHQPMRELADEGFRDAAELTNHWEPTWPANHLGPGMARFFPPLARIDQVLVSSSIAALTADTVRIDNTDHLTVVAEVAPSDNAR